MALSSIQQQIESEKKAIADSRKKIADLKNRERDRLTKWIMKSAEKAGVLEADISDTQLDEAMENLAKSANSSRSNTSKSADIEETAETA